MGVNGHLMTQNGFTHPNHCTVSGEDMADRIWMKTEIKYDDRTEYLEGWYPAPTPREARIDEAVRRVLVPYTISGGAQCLAEVWDDPHYREVARYWASDIRNEYKRLAA